MIDFLIFAAAAAASPAATPAQLPPEDNCKGNIDFAYFKAHLYVTVKKRDADALKEMMAQNVQMTFAGPTTVMDFMRDWKLVENPKDSPVWPELRNVMRLGCAPTPDGLGYVMPGMFEKAGDDIDPFDLVVARNKAVLYDKPDAGAKKVATLDWHTATVVEGQAPEGWAQVKLVDGREGWLQRADFVSPLDRRLVINRINGQWLITSFVEGD